MLAPLGAANAAGYAFDLYARFWWLDRVLHACTVFAITLWPALFVCGRVLDGRGGHRVLLVLVLASVGLAIGALWEVAEWGFDQIAPSDVVKGKNDTIIDIVMDTFGALGAGALGLKSLRPDGRPAGASTVRGPRP